LVEILDLVLAAFAVGTVHAMDLVRAMEFGAVQRDQYVPIQVTHGVKAATLVQFSDNVSKHRMEPVRLDRVELGSYLAIAGNFAHPEQRLAVRPALAGLQMTLMRQERRALHEERRERRQAEIRHVVGRVLAPPLVRQRPAATTQGIEKAVQDWHGVGESEIRRRGNPENHPDQRYRRSCGI